MSRILKRGEKPVLSAKEKVLQESIKKHVVYVMTRPKRHKKWMTLMRITNLVGRTTSAVISARLRDLDSDSSIGYIKQSRKPRFDGDPWHYRLVPVDDKNLHINSRVSEVKLLRAEVRELKRKVQKLRKRIRILKGEGDEI